MSARKWTWTRTRHPSERTEGSVCSVPTPYHYHQEPPQTDECLRE